MLEDDIFTVLQPIISSNFQCELLEVEFNSGNLKLIVDKPGGVNVNELSKINRLSHEIIEQQNLVSGNYALEVSSPGLERELKTESQFSRAIGQNISIKYSSDGKNFEAEGELIKVDSSGIDVSLNKLNNKKTSEKIKLNFDQIIKAKTIFDWRSALSKNK